MINKPETKPLDIKPIPVKACCQDKANMERERFKFVVIDTCRVCGEEWETDYS